MPKKKRHSHQDGRELGRSRPQYPMSMPDGRLGDEAPRLEVLKELGGQLVIGLGGALMLGFGMVLGWMTVADLRRGYLDEGDQLVYASQEPVWFWISIIFFVAMGLGCGVLGAQMMQHGWGERRYTARLAKRLLSRERGAGQ